MDGAPEDATSVCGMVASVRDVEQVEGPAVLRQDPHCDLAQSHGLAQSPEAMEHLEAAVSG